MHRKASCQLIEQNTGLQCHFLVDGCKKNSKEKSKFSGSKILGVDHRYQ